MNKKQNLAKSTIYMLFQKIGLSMQEGYDVLSSCKKDIELLALEENKPLEIRRETNSKA